MNRLFLLVSFFIVSTLSARAEIIKDEFIENHLKTIDIKKPIVNTNYNYESFERVPIKLKISEKISTKKDGVYDEMPLVFFVKEDVKYKGKVILKKNDVVKANVETFFTRGMNGIPGTIIVDDFVINGISPKKVKGTYIKRGLNLSLLVFPIKWALTPIPGAGSLTNFILGGNAKITKRNTVTIYYYPEWAEF